MAGMTDSKQHSVPNVYGAANTTNEQHLVLWRRWQEALVQVGALEEALEQVGNALPDPMHPHFPREFVDAQCDAIAIISRTLEDSDGGAEDPGRSLGRDEADAQAGGGATADSSAGVDRQATSTLATPVSLAQPLTPDDYLEIQARLTECRGQIEESPYTHTTAAGWYAHDVPALLSCTQALGWYIERVSGLEEQLEAEQALRIEVAKLGADTAARLEALDLDNARLRNALRRIADAPWKSATVTGDIARKALDRAANPYPANESRPVRVTGVLNPRGEAMVEHDLGKADITLSNPATSSGTEPVSRREVAGVSVPEASSPASPPLSVSPPVEAVSTTDGGEESSPAISPDPMRDVPSGEFPDENSVFFPAISPKEGA